MTQLKKLEVITSPSQIGSTWLQQEQLSTHMSHYPQHRASRASWRGQHDRVFVQITTTDGQTGIGATRGTASAVIVLEHLSRFLEGRELADHAAIYSEMASAQLTYGWSGIAAAALSAVDLALWDLRAKQANVSLAALLSPERTARRTLDCYTTVHPENLGDAAGFAGVKIAARYGPEDGVSGPRLAAQDIQRVREGVTPETLVMVDTACSWDADFVLAMLDELGEGTLDWLEDPLLPWDLDGYARIKDRISETNQPLRLCLGNYAFSPQDGHQVLREGFVDVFQPDATWVGGLSAMIELQQTANSRGLAFSPHYGAMHPWVIQLLSVLPEDELAEYIATSSSPIRDDYPALALPAHGRQPVPDSPGCAAELGPDVLRDGTRQTLDLTA